MTSADQFRRAIAQLPTGVTVITADGEQGPAGATANAVTSLSLEPPLMLACLDRGSRTLAGIEHAGRFGVNVLHAGQEDVARAFSTKAPHAEKWHEIAWEERLRIPALSDRLVWVACELREARPAGDHVVLTGAVLEVEGREGDPLVFHAGGYRGLEAGGG